MTTIRDIWADYLDLLDEQSAQVRQMELERRQALVGVHVIMPRLRRLLDWNERKLATYLGCTVEAIERIESGRMTPTTVMVSRLAVLEATREVDYDNQSSDSCAPGTERIGVAGNRAAIIDSENNT